MTLEELKVVISANTKQLEKSLDKVNSKLEKLDGVTKKTSKGVGSDMAKSMFKASIAANLVTKAITALSNILRKIPKFFNDAIKTSDLFENSLLGLESVAGKKLGAESLPAVNQAAKTLASDGLMTIADSALGLKNLLATGLSLEQAINLMNVFKDSAAFGRQSSLSFGKAVTSATEGVKNGNSILVDNAGITKNLSVILTEAGYSQSDMTKFTTDAGVQQAIYNGLIKEGNLFLGDAAKLSATSAGQTAKLGATMQTFLAEVGDAIKPIKSVLSASISAFFSGVTGTIVGSQKAINSAVARIAGVLLGLVRVIGRLLSFLPFVGAGFAKLANLTVSMSSGASNAGGAVDGMSDSFNGASDAIDGTSGSAKKLKNELKGLAGFDEMTVLQEDGSTGGAGGTGGIGDIGGLGGLGAIEDAFNIDDITADVDAFASMIEEKVIAKFEALKGWIDKNEKALNILKTTLAVVAVVLLVSMVPALIAAIKFNAWYIASLVAEKIGLIATAVAQGLLTVATSLWSVVVGVATVATWLFNAALTVLTSPIFLVILAIVALIAIGVLIYKNWDWISAKAKEFGEIVKNAFLSMKNKVVSYFNYMKDALNYRISIIRSSLTAIGDYVKNTISGKFNTFKNNVIGAFTAIKSVGMNIWEGIKAGFKNGINGVINLVNGFVRRINSLITKVNSAGDSLGISPISFRVGEIPKLAKGGIVSESTLANIGENGAEAVLPLENNTSWMDTLVDKINGGGQRLAVYLGEDKIFDKFIDYANEKTLATNSTILNI